MAAETITSAFLTAQNLQPLTSNTAGEGVAGRMRSVTDYVTTTSNGMSVSGSSYALCRFPTNAKIKVVTIDFGIVDSSTAAAAVFDINVAFSSSTIDGTKTAYQGLLPITTVSAQVPVSIATYTAANILFGQKTPGSNAASLSQQVTFNGTFAAWFPGGRDIPLYKFFGFKNAQGADADPGGYFTLLLYLSTAARTAAAASIAARVEYVA